MLRARHPATDSSVRTPPPTSSGRPAAVPDDLAMLALDDHGKVLECNPTCEQRFGYRKDELTGRHISTLFPELGGMELVMEERINSRLAFLCHSGIPFRALHRDGKQLTSEVFINRLDRHNVVLLARSLDKTGQDRAR